MNKNSMCYWYHLIAELGIPTPITYAFMFSNPKFDSLVKDFAEIIRYPLFMKTDLAAAKHDWEKSCFVRNADELNDHMDVLFETDAIWERVGATSRAIVLREFIEMDSSFTAFAGNMPINVERRYFISQGKVICHHPYWPPETFESGHPDRQPHDPDWRAKLAVMNDESKPEITLLMGYAERVGEVMPEYWSVDFAKSRQGKWYLIDMALGENSFHWPDCPKIGGN